MRLSLILPIICLVTLAAGCAREVAGPAATASIAPTNMAVPPTWTPLPTETVTPVTVNLNEADADVTWVRAVQRGDSWTFHVTVAHPDTGWEDYADGWDVVLPDGTVIKPDVESPFTRLLFHPHENEQPFTRSQSGIVIPDGVTEVTVRAHDLVAGFGGQEIIVFLNQSEGDGFVVERS